MVFIFVYTVIICLYTFICLLFIYITERCRGQSPLRVGQEGKLATDPMMGGQQSTKTKPDTTLQLNREPCLPVTADTIGPAQSKAAPLIGWERCPYTMRSAAGDCAFNHGEIWIRTRGAGQAS